MGSSRPISIFANDTAAQRRPYAYVISACSHVLVAGLVLYGFIFAPRINMRAAADRFTVREVDIAVPEVLRRQNAGDSGMYPGEKKTSERKLSEAHSAASAPSSSIRQIPQLHLSDRTVVQPDISMNEQVLKKTNLPSLLLWSENRPKVQLITPPPPQKLAFVDTKPVLTRPTPEKALADVPITSTPFASKLPMPTPATSSPVKVNGPNREEWVPETSLANSSNPSAASMMSISEIELSKGRVALPPVNQTAKGNADGSMQPGTSGNSAQRGNGDPNSHGSDHGIQESQGSGGKAPGGTGNRTGESVAVNGGNGGNGAAPSGSSTGGGGSGTAPSFTRVNIPQTGQYGVVVVGSEMAEQFPETTRLWGGRLVYSVFLHMGMTKNWILQYTLPQAEGVDSNDLKHVEAPWPFFVVRPTQSLGDIRADALMVHGIVNEAGHFESLSVVFPNGYREGQLVIAALQQWKFRPAKHNGQIAKVEVLLIIPEDLD